MFDPASDRRTRPRALEGSFEGRGALGARRGWSFERSGVPDARRGARPSGWRRSASFGRRFRFEGPHEIPRATLHHPNIVQFLGYARTPALTLVIELFPEGSLERFVPREKPGQKTSLRFCIDMALAIEYLHSRQPSIVIHRDIKPANFLLTASLRVKLGDFGIARTRKGKGVDRTRSCESLATMLDSSMHGVSSLGSMEDHAQADAELRVSGDDLTSNCGTVRFMAPEVAAVDGARTQAYDSKADIFSLAMVYYFVWERALPGIPECN